MRVSKRSLFFRTACVCARVVMDDVTRIGNRRSVISMSPDDIAQTLRVFLASVGTLGLATTDEHGLPYAANVNFAADDAMNLYFVSHPDSAHARHSERRSQVAGTMYAPFTRPEDIRGVQFRGRCDPVGAGDFGRVWALYVRKFPYAVQFEDRIRTERFYRITPGWIRMIDNTIRFGYKWETDWPVRRDVQA